MNVCENVIIGARLFPDHDAVVYQQQRMTYAQLEDLSCRAARALLEQGVRRGDRVGIRLPNVPSFVVWYYATLRIGAVAVSISTRLAPREVAFILSDCQARAAIIDEANVDALRSDLPESTQHLVAVSDSAARCQGELLSAEPTLPAPTWVDSEPQDPAVILYTSGTTGSPKGATLSHRNVRATVHAFNHLCNMRTADRILLAVPLFHCYGQNALLNAGLNVGATLILQHGFDLNESKRLIADHQVTKLFGVPTTFQLMWDCFQPADLSSVDYCFSAAATLPIQLSRRWQEKFRMPIYEGYGLTETAPFASYNHRCRFVPGSIGTPVDLVEMKVVDTETGQKCPPGALGEIAIRGPNVMLGYWNRPEETAQAVRDGWFHSGDIGRMDEDGYFYIVDRLKDMISVGGTKVFPAEVERVLLDHSAVSEAAVVGFPDPVFGEQVVGFIVPSDGAVEHDQLRRHCLASLAAYKVPKHTVVVDELPRNPTGKILKTRLREVDLSDVLYARGSDAAEGVAAAAVTRGSGDEDRPPAQRPVQDLLAARLREIHPAGRQQAIVSLIEEQLREMTATEIVADPEMLLVDTGLDSLGIVELRDRLQLHVGEQLELPATLVFDHPRIRDLASFLLSSLDPDAHPCGSVTESAGDPSPQSAAETRTVSSPAPASASIKVDATASTSPADAREDIDAMSEQQALQELLRELND